MSGPGKYHVTWARVAEQDVTTIVEYLITRSPAAALKAWNHIRSTAENLRTMPRRGRVVPELGRCGISRYREVIAKTWRILYRIDSNKVHVVAVVDARRNFEDALLARIR